MRVGLLLVLLAGLIAGCAGFADSKKMSALEARQKTFSKAIRWGAYDLAAALIKKRDDTGEAVDVRDLKRYEAIRVTAYDELGSRMTADRSESISKVVFHFYHAERGSVHKLIHTQLWWFDDATQSWYLDGELPDFFSVLGSSK